MRFVRTDNLKPGMRLARPIYNKNGVLLYERNTKLTMQGIFSIFLQKELIIRTLPGDSPALTEKEDSTIKGNSDGMSTSAQTVSPRLTPLTAFSRPVRSRIPPQTTARKSTLSTLSISTVLKLRPLHLSATQMTPGSWSQPIQMPQSSNPTILLSTGSEQVMLMTSSRSILMRTVRSPSTDMIPQLRVH